MVMIMTMGKIVKMVTMVRMVTMVMMENIRKILKIMKMKTSTDQDENLKYKLNCVFLFLITNRFFFYIFSCPGNLVKFALAAPRINNSST